MARAQLSLTQRRAQLVDAAIVVMAREGISRATTRAIVAEAGVSLSTFHYCFSSKRLLLEAVIEHLGRQSVATVAAALDGAHEMPLDLAVRAALQAYWEHVVAHPDAHRLSYALTQYAIQRAELETLARQQYRNYRQVVAGLLFPVIESAELRFKLPLDVVIDYIAALLDGLTLNYLVLGDSPTSDAVLETFADHLTSLAE